MFHRRQRVQRGSHRHHNHIAGIAADVVQRREAFRDQVLMRREVVVRQCLPVRKQVHAQIGCEERDFLNQSLRFQRIGGDHYQRRLHEGGGGATGYPVASPCVNSVQPLAGNGLPDFVMQGLISRELCQPERVG